MYFRVAALFALTLAAPAAHTADKRAVTIEDYYRVLTPSGLSASSDGKWLAYSVRATDLGRGKAQSDLWRIAVSGGEPERLTWTEDASETDPVFSGDGKRLAFVAQRGEQEHDQVWVLDVSGGEARSITDISTGASDLVWSPDGKHIAFTSLVYADCGADDACNEKRAKTRADGPSKAHLADELLYRHWTSWADGQVNHVFVVEVATGKVRDLTPGESEAPRLVIGGERQYEFSPDSAELVYSRNPDPPESLAWSTNGDVWVVPVAPDENGKTRPAKNLTVENHAWDGLPRYSPDGRFIAYVRQTQPGYESDILRLALLDRKTGKVRVLTEAFDNWVESFEWLPDSSGLVFSAPEEGQVPLFRVDVAGGAARKLATLATIHEFTLSPDGRRAYAIRSSIGEPREVWQIDFVARAAPRRLSFHNRALEAEVDFRPGEPMWVDGAQGKRVQLFVIKPHGFDASKKYPLILNVHGGPQGNWSDAFRGDWQMYPGAGYVVALPNPHGSTGYGQEFTAQISGDWGGAAYEDLMRVTDALEKLPYVDASRMGAMGWSYGGYMMNWFQGHTTRFKCIADMMGLFDLRSFYLTTEELWFPEWDLKGRPWDSELYEKWSPSNAMANFKTPQLIVTGEIDFRVDFAQGLMAFTALRRQGIPARLIVLPGSGHWPGWHDMALYYTAHLDWFHRWLGGDPAPWSVEDFVNNAVFDKETGKRVEKKE